MPKSRAEALAFPKGDLELAFCLRCGFIQNRLFAPERLDYSAGYGETQGFSPTFSGWAKHLVRQLVEQYGVQGQTVLEIGCGQGEFLAELCQAGKNRGIGIDPGLALEHPSHPERIEWIGGVYEDHAERTREAQAVLCRHTLEHIAPVGAFVGRIRAAMHPQTLLFLEVPDTRRILEEKAFWDIYYEHCSYFTQGSLGRLLRAQGFRVLENRRAYGDQYVLAFARADQANPAFPEENDLEGLHRLVRAFKAAALAAIQHWRARLEAWREAGKRVVLWAASSKSVAFLTTLEVGEEVACAVDINPHKRGHYLPGSGHPVVGPEDLEHAPPDVVLVMNPIYAEEIRRDLARRGLEPELVLLR
ncbi:MULTISPECIES: class I SAM-dependent methyltransferase [unclassified Meiothermus]|uniref:class I SAM-dependent methyltransferase n=1 Tax=unclassified Meiothermus TaxID=370471 RepID=UPI001F1A3F3A|nr:MULTISPECIES: class I SAM-dependent methyltransferase [unclassified Meiothermus]